ncbi:MAG: hypothetical protein QOG25_2625 [Acetobacteraceae bacterium]|jgi:hypothetical protein|nr:hypothetical protein [Acetobacteraceae bacterium]
MPLSQVRTVAGVLAATRAWRVTPAPNRNRPLDEANSDMVFCFA